MLITLTYPVFMAFNTGTVREVNTFLMSLDAAMYAYGKYEYVWDRTNHKCCISCMVPFVHDEYIYVRNEWAVCLECALEKAGADNFRIPKVLLSKGE